MMNQQDREWAYQTKQGVYTKEEVDLMLSLMRQFTYETKASLPEASANTMWKIYLIPSTNSKDGNVKDEFITIATVDGSTVTYSWEQVGSTTADLTDYLKTSGLGTALTALTSVVLTLPTSDPQVAGQLWNDSGTVKVSAGE